jgi:HTH-type transcriptional regulator/antitoxin HipB
MNHVVLLPRHLGQILIARRKALKLSQEALAVQLGISQNRLSELEADPSRLSLDRLIAWAHVLGLELFVRDKAESVSTSEW